MMQNTQQQFDFSHLSQSLGLMAEQALFDEIHLSPKPGLVDRYNTGAHVDLSISLMEQSARCLTPYFTMIADICEHQPIGLKMRENIGQLGRDAEDAMLQKTKGINTHRGAIWALGLLTAATISQEKINTIEDICFQAATLANLEDASIPSNLTISKGQKACQKYRVSGAKEQAQHGFPAIVNHALPTLKKSRTNGEDENIARLNTLLAIMSQLTDTCVLNRSGMAGLHLMHRTSKEILDMGGVGKAQGMQLLHRLDRQMIKINASPGGAADLLAATLFLDYIEKSRLFM